MNHYVHGFRGFGFGALLLLASVARAESPPRPAIVELYTSEGCSSCPPAEALLEKLATRPDVLPLAFHVDYWDDLGWQDRFSLKQASARQESFARTLRLSTTGTPQFVVNGRASVWGARPEQIENALKTPRRDVPIVANNDGDALIVRAPARITADLYEVFVMSYLPHAITAIERGENAGRNLSEVNVVRDVRKLGQLSSAAQEWRVAVSSFPRDAGRAVVLVQAAGTGEIVGARDLQLRSEGSGER